MAKVIGDVVFPSGKYIKDGEEKTRWIRCGTLLETDKGMRIKLDCIPVVTDPSGMWFSVFEKEEAPRPVQQAPQPTAAAPAVQPGIDGDMPF
jgi:hypothetical protein